MANWGNISPFINWLNCRYYQWNKLCNFWTSLRFIFLSNATALPASCSSLTILWRSSRQKASICMMRMEDNTLTASTTLLMVSSKSCYLKPCFSKHSKAQSVLFTNTALCWGKVCLNRKSGRNLSRACSLGNHSSHLTFWVCKCAFQTHFLFCLPRDVLGQKLQCFSMKAQAKHPNCKANEQLVVLLGW